MLEASSVVAEKAPAASTDDPDRLKAGLAEIFARVLRRGHVDEEADFFDLGGDSLLAVTLLLEIQKLTGRELPITAIYEAPSVRSIAAILRDGATQRESDFVVLKSGAQEKPLFLVHGLGGTVIELRELANRIDAEQMIYGIEARGLDGAAEPFDRIEDMARFHVGELTRVQPEGPYFLAGYSFGGLVALEMAQVLSRAGRKVALLALVDTFPHDRFWPPLCRLMALRKLLMIEASGGAWTQAMRHYVAALRAMPLNKAVGFLFSRAARAARMPFNLFRLGAVLYPFANRDAVESAATAPADVFYPESLVRVHRAAAAAFASYRPKFYAGEIIFIKSEDPVPIPFDARLLWGRMCDQLTVDILPGDHFTLVREPEALAELLSARIRTASKTGADAAATP